MTDQLTETRAISAHAPSPMERQNKVSVRDLKVQYGKSTAVDGLSFTVATGEILCILGSSGSGKTTTLRCVAGLLRPTSGTIEIDGVIVSDSKTFLSPDVRKVGMVFQSYALWPHMTVARNIGYGLKKSGLSKAALAQRVEESMDMVGLSGFADRYPSELSGGQQQRVAIARSVATQPSLLLLDEPLSNLDTSLRERMRDDLRRVIRDLNMTAVFITHDQAEAMVIADRIIVMRDGREIQEGPPRELYRWPKDVFVARFLGPASFVTGRSGTVDPQTGTCELKIEGGQTIKYTPSFGQAEGEQVTVICRPEILTLGTEPIEGMNNVPGTVVAVSFLGGHTHYEVRADESVQFRVHGREGFEIGDQVQVSFAAADVVSVGQDPLGRGAATADSAT